MSNSPKISIIVPTLNQGQFIEQTILSILNQTYKNFEIIIIDGGSADKTIEIIKKYEKQIAYWISEKDSGQSSAINKGLKIATGEIITWLNSDDYYESTTLQIVIDAFTINPEVSILHGKTLLFGEQTKSKVIGLEKDILLHEYLAYMRFPQPSSFLKKEFLNSSFPINESLHYAMDFELIARAILLGAKIKRIDVLLSHYRLHKDSKSNQDIKFLEEWAIVVHTIFLSTGNKTFAKKLEELGLVKPMKTNNLATKINFNNESLEAIFLLHLNLHYHYNYRLFNYDTCAKISVFLHDNYNSFYLANNYNKYDFRRKFIPKFIFKIVRGLKN